MALRKKAAKKTSGPAPYFRLTGITGTGKKTSYTEHGVGWAFATKNTAGISFKLNSWPIGDEVVAYGKKEGDEELFQSPGNSPDYTLHHAAVDGDGKTSYTEIGVGWVFDKRSDEDPEGPHGISFRLKAVPFDGNVVAFQYSEQSG